MVAVYLQGKWWPIGDVLKTSDGSRHGLVLVSKACECGRCDDEMFNIHILAGGISDGESRVIPAQSGYIWNPGKASQRRPVFFGLFPAGARENSLARRRSGRVLYL